MTILMGLPSALVERSRVWGPGITISLCANLALVAAVVAEGMFAAAGADDDFSLGALDLGTSETLEQVRQAGTMCV